MNHESKPFKRLKFVPPHFNRGKISSYVVSQNMCHGKRDTKMKFDFFSNQKKFEK